MSFKPGDMLSLSKLPNSYYIVHDFTNDLNYVLYPIFKSYFHTSYTYDKNLVNSQFILITDILRDCI
jgi:hypothetical protein